MSLRWSYHLWNWKLVPARGNSVLRSWQKVGVFLEPGSDREAPGTLAHGGPQHCLPATSRLSKVILYLAIIKTLIINNII